MQLYLPWVSHRGGNQWTTPVGLYHPSEAMSVEPRLLSEVYGFLTNRPFGHGHQEHL